MHHSLEREYWVLPRHAAAKISSDHARRMANISATVLLQYGITQEDRCNDTCWKGYQLLDVSLSEPRAEAMRASNDYERNSTIRICVLQTDGGCTSHLSTAVAAGTDGSLTESRGDASDTENGFIKFVSGLADIQHEHKTSVYKSWESCMTFNNRSKL